MGPSGSGKSTFMNLLGCLDTPTTGDYSSGREVAHMEQDDLARLCNRTIGFVFQGFNLLPRMSLEDNVALPLVYGGVDKGTNGARRPDAGQVGLGNYAASLPNHISGGQQQRVAIARALVNQPQLILADEPTGNLGQPTPAKRSWPLRGIEPRRHHHRPRHPRGRHRRPRQAPGAFPRRPTRRRPAHRPAAGGGAVLKAMLSEAWRASLGANRLRTA